MSPGSLIGFGLVFVFCTWIVSVVAGLALALTAPRLRQLGSAAEKRAAALALLLPPLFALVVTTLLAVFSLAPALLGAVDHCDGHGHHLHLCLVHGGEWAHRAWAMSLVAGLATVFAVRLVRLLDGLARGRRRLVTLERSSVQISGGDLPVYLAPSTRAFCFVAGLTAPKVFVAKSWWNSLTSQQRQAIVDHERGHVANRDLARSMVLSVCALLGAPVVAAGCQRLWSDAAERLCDRMAADGMGDPAPLASALVQMARSQRMVGALSFLPKAESVSNRVVAVLTLEATGRSVADRLGRTAMAMWVVVSLAMALLVDPLHHTLETLLAAI